MHARFISIFHLFLLIYLDSNAEAAQKQSYHLNSTDNTASLPLSLECDGKASKINNTPCMRSYCRHELHLMVLLFLRANDNSKVRSCYSQSVRIYSTIERRLHRR